MPLRRNRSWAIDRLCDAMSCPVIDLSSWQYSECLGPVFLIDGSVVANDECLLPRHTIRLGPVSRAKYPISAPSISNRPTISASVGGNRDRRETAIPWESHCPLAERNGILANLPVRRRIALKCRRRFQSQCAVQEQKTGRRRLSSVNK